MPILRPYRIRRNRRSLRTLDPAMFLPHPPAPSGPLTVIAVTGLDDGVYRFAFSGPVSLSGGDVSAIEVGIAGDDLWFPASDPVLVSAMVIDIGIGSNSFSDWRILTQPVAIVQALAVPMSGTVS
jgi:hypothetical protein